MIPVAASPRQMWSKCCSHRDPRDEREAEARGRACCTGSGQAAPLGTLTTVPGVAVCRTDGKKTGAVTEGPTGAPGKTTEAPN